MKARFNYRIYPTQGEKHRLARLFGCVRVVWNDSLAGCQEKYKLGEKKPINSELQKQFITQAKKTEDREWLSEVSTIPRQESLNDLNQASQNFFQSTKGKRKGKPVKPPDCFVPRNAPRFKSRKSKQTARCTKDGFKVGQYKVPSNAKIGKLKTVWSRELPNVPSLATVIKDCSGDSRIATTRYFLSFVVEIQPETLAKTENSVGIDLGIKTFATVGTLHTTSLHSQKIDAPKPLKKRINKYRKLSKSLSKKTKGSKRYEKARIRVAKFYAKLKDTRTDFLHKLSTEIIRENPTIVLEDLKVYGIVNNPTTTLALAKHLFKRQVASGQTRRRRKSHPLRPRDEVSLFGCRGHKTLRYMKSVSLRDMKNSGRDSEASHKRCNPVTMLALAKLVIQRQVTRERAPREGMLNKRRNVDQEREGGPRDSKLSRAISDLDWRQFRTLLEGKAEKYGRDFRVISKWEAKSQNCSSCAFKGGKLDFKVREWECLNCGAKHDRDENVAINRLVAGGHSETLNGRGGKCKTTAKVAACETSTNQGAMAR